MTKEALRTIIKTTNKGLTLPCIIQPRSSQNKIIGIYDDRLKIKLTTPPVDGKANAALIKYLSKLINRPKSEIRLSAGTTSRRKMVLLSNISNEDLIDKITEMVK